MEKEIIVNNKDIFFGSIRTSCIELGDGAEGTTYEYGKNVIKILDGYDDRGHSKEEYLQFSDLKTKYIYFPKQVITCNNEVIATISKKCPGKNIMDIDPLTIDLNKFMNAYNDLSYEIIDLTNKRILFYDVPCNCMYYPGKMGIIDTGEFTYDDKNPDKLIADNLGTVQQFYLDFLIDGYFNNFIKNNNKLYDLYFDIKTSKINVYIDFLKLFQKELSNYCNSEIIKLGDAQKAIVKTIPTFSRSIF